MTVIGFVMRSVLLMSTLLILRSWGSGLDVLDHDGMWSNTRGAWLMSVRLELDLTRVVQQFGGVHYFGELDAELPLLA